MPEQNYPNPFNPSTTITYQLPEGEKVELTIHSLTGQRVVRLVSATQPAGYYTVTWDGRDEVGRQVAAGVYLYEIRAGAYRAVRKMVLVK